jgi:hypothetical protein
MCLLSGTTFFTVHSSLYSLLIAIEVVTEATIVQDVTPCSVVEVR